MFIDCHSHLGELSDHKAVEYWKANHRIPDWVADPYLEAMEIVDKAIILSHWGPLSINSNECVAHFVSEHGDKFIPFYNVDPREPSSVAEIGRLIKEMGGKGVKLGPLYQDFKPDEEQYFPLYERIQELGVPILWHQSTSCDQRFGRLEWARPILLDKIARTFPDLKMIIAHFGFPWIGEVVALVGKHPNVYTDISALTLRTWSLYNGLVQMIQYGFEEKVFFGTDFPWFKPADMRQALYQAAEIPKGTNMPPIPVEVVEGILNRDVPAMLGIG
ncbi:MAG: amidohydrolase [Anaerolineales bacterium]|nr:amidohydrolase [Anaerolineales bacterium]